MLNYANIMLIYVNVRLWPLSDHMQYGRVANNYDRMSKVDAFNLRCLSELRAWQNIVHNS